MSWIYFNGKHIQPDKAVVPITDRGFLYGHGVFETMRAYSGMPFRAEAHLKRFAESAKALDIPLPYDLENILLEILSLIRENELENASIRLTLSKGAGGKGLWTEEKTRPNFAIVVTPFEPYPAKWHTEGVKVVITKYRRDPLSPLNGIKSANYLLNALAFSEAKAIGAEEAVFVNTNGLITEGTISNIFAVLDDIIITPSEEDGLLPGITRQATMEIARREKLPLHIGPLKPEELVTADEVFLTNSLMEILPVREVNGRPRRIGTPGPVTKRIAKWYRELVENESKEKSVF